MVLPLANIISYIIGLAIAFQIITAMLLLILGKNTPFVILVNKLYEETPRGTYDKIMNAFYYAYFGIAVLLFQIAIERFGGIKGRLVFLLEGIGILVVLAILANIPHMF